MKSFALLLGLLFAQLVLAEEVVSAPGNESGDFIYTVKSGDTLGKLSKDFLDTPSRWREVAAYNQLPDANRIEPGQTLHIQLPWMKSRSGTAKVEAVTGAVSANGHAVKTGDELAVGAGLQTTQGAAARLRLPDGSLINVMESSQLRIEKLEQKPGNSFSSLLRLVVGQIEAFKTKFPAGQADLDIRSRVATLGVRGTHFRVRQQDQNSFAEIEEGLVSFDAEKTPQTLALAGGEGSVADGEHAAEVIPLLPAPTFPALPALFDTPYIEWVMPESAGATAYTGELAQDEEFSRGVKAIHGEGRAIFIKDLPDGQYWLKLRAVDSHGLQGMEGKMSFSVKVRPRRFATTKTYITGSSMQLRWVSRTGNTHYQVQIASTQQFDKVMFDLKTADNFVEMPRPKAGRYFMRVRNILSGGRAEEWDVPMMFEAP